MTNPQTDAAALVEAFLEASMAPDPVRARGYMADDVRITFSNEAGQGFYEQIESAIEAGDEEPLFDFARMPKDWRVPDPQPPAESATLGGARSPHSQNQERRATH